MEDLFRFGKQVLASQPFSRFLEADLTALAPGVAEITLPVKEDLKQQHGFVHGGVLSYLADNALTFAGGSVLGPNVVTLEYKINYLRPAMGSVLIARAKVVHSGRVQAVCRCEVFVKSEHGEERLCAVSQGTIAKMGSPSE